MSDAPYQRATRRHRVAVDHTDGDRSEGYLLVPVGMGYDKLLMQAEQFIPFELTDGARVFLALASIKRVRDMAEQAPERDRGPVSGTSTCAGDEEDDPRKGGQKFRGSDVEAMRRRERAARAHAERMRREKIERAATMRREAREEYDDIVQAMRILNLPLDAPTEEIQTAYRRLVKTHHPDRLRGEGGSEEAVRRAAERLAQINKAYKLLADDPAAA